MLKIAVMVSGGGTNLQAIIDGIDQGTITNTQIAVVISNNANAYALERAKKAGIDGLCISPKQYADREQFNAALLAKKGVERGKYYASIEITEDFSKNIVSVLTKDIHKAEIIYREQFNAALLAKVQEYEVDLIVLAGFLVVIPEIMIDAYENRIINIHPSLIPSFCGTGYYGLKVHEAALARGVKVSGATVHFVDKGTDTGPIILQKPVSVLEEDTPESLQRRIMEQAEWKIMPQAIDWIANGKVRVEQGRVHITE